MYKYIDEYLSMVYFSIQYISIEYTKNILTDWMMLKYSNKNIFKIHIAGRVVIHGIVQLLFKTTLPVHR